jgi:hypothetical protein
MNWARRVLTDTDDDGRFRSGLAAILGASIAILSLLFGLVDAETFLIAAPAGFIVVAPLWRFVGEDLNRPMPIFAFVAFLVASVIVLRQLPGLAFAVFIGSFTFTLGVLRFANGWRNPVPRTPAPELEPRPVQPLLVLALVLPLLLLAVVIVIGVLVEGRVFR